MNRFRRKSESRSRRKEANGSQREPSSEVEAPKPPTLLLPEPSNFRTSLILVSGQWGAGAWDGADSYSVATSHETVLAFEG